MRRQRCSISLPWEGRGRCLDEHKDTVTSLHNIGYLLQHMRDYVGALDYYQQALRVQEKVLGKTYPETLTTIMNMAIVYRDVAKDFAKAEEMYMIALNGREKSLWKDHEDTKMCARNLAFLLARDLKDKEKTRAIIAHHPRLAQGDGYTVSKVRPFIA